MIPVDFCPTNQSFNLIIAVDPLGKEMFWIEKTYLFIFGTIGLLGSLLNIFTIAVLFRSKMRKRVFYNLLLALAFFDTLFILPFSLNAYMSSACLPEYGVGVFDWLYPVRELSLVGSIYMTVAISMERYLGICHPHLTYSRGALVFILPVIFISFAFIFPKLLELKPEWSSERGIFIMGYTEFYAGFEMSYIYGYHIWTEIIIKTIIPLVFLLFLNGSIIITIKRRSHVQRPQGNSTKILFCVVLVFMISHAPRVVRKIAGVNILQNKRKPFPKTANKVFPRVTHKPYFRQNLFLFFHQNYQTNFKALVKQIPNQGTFFPKCFIWE